MIKIEQRASVVLYRFLIANCKNFHYLLPANVCPVVPLTFLKANVDFSFVDIDPVTHSGSYQEYLKSLEAIGTEKKGIVFVNAYGFKQKCSDFYQRVKSQHPGMVIIEDNCLCIPETFKSEPSHFVDLELYSTGPSKYAPIAEEGGYGIYDADKWKYSNYSEYYNADENKETFYRLKQCRLHDWTFSYEDCNWLQFIKTKEIHNLSDEQYLKKVADQVIRSMEHKKIINAIYDSNLPDGIKMDGVYHNWRYMLLLPKPVLRQRILNRLEEEGLYASPHYRSVAYMFNKQRCINAEKEAPLLLNLFNSVKYTEEMALKTTAIINKTIAEYD